MRRFELPREVEAGGEFVLNAADESGRPLGKRTIKIIDRRTALLTEMAENPTGLDNFGRFSPTGSLFGGLSYQLVHANGGEPPETPLRVFAEDLGSNLDPEKITANPGAKFLDSLSKHGSMTYGRAKSLLHRLLP